MGCAVVVNNSPEYSRATINSAFGLLGGLVAFIATTLIIAVMLAVVFWNWGADDDIIAKLVKKATVSRCDRTDHVV